MQNGNEEDSLEAEEGRVGEDSHTPKAFGDISLGKRTNPFKVLFQQSIHGYTVSNSFSLSFFPGCHASE